MSQEYTEEEQETFSIVSSNISNDFIIIGQSADEQGEKYVNGSNGNPQPDLPLPAIETTGKSNLEWQIEALKAQNQMLKEKMKNMELEQKNARLQDTMRKWQLNEAQVDKIAVMAIQQEQNQKEMQELKGKMADMQIWQRSQHRVDELSELKSIQQEHHQKEMQDLELKMAEYSKEFSEKLENQDKRHKREIANMKDFINTHVRGSQQQQKEQVKCSSPSPKSSANANNEKMVHLTNLDMQKIIMEQAMKKQIERNLERINRDVMD